MSQLERIQMTLDKIKNIKNFEFKNHYFFFKRGTNLNRNIEF